MADNYVDENTSINLALLIGFTIYKNNNLDESLSTISTVNQFK